MKALQLELAPTKMPRKPSGAGMHVNSIQVYNYKGFHDSGKIELDPSWNIVVGQNNSGKTALIDCLSLVQFRHRPHKNQSQGRSYARPEVSYVEAKIGTSGPELENLVLRNGGQFIIPLPDPNQNEPQSFVDQFFLLREIELALTFRGDNSGVAPTSRPSHGLFQLGPTHVDGVVNITEKKQRSSVSRNNNGNDSLPGIIRNYANEFFYTFKAERFAVGQCGVGTTTILSSDAGNLASVLQIMSANPELYREFNHLVSAIFPTVQWISSVPVENNRCELRIWTTSTADGRDDLAIPLSECGTGLGQALAILYVAMTHPPGMIAIDEPNSFLHPGASKKLIQILRSISRHQYVISTHSADVIGVSMPSRLHVVKFGQQGSSVESFADTTVDTQRMMLNEIGVSLSDVLSSERIIWVEGPTERECFELISKRHFPHLLIGASFVSVRSTGDFGGRAVTARAMLEIYDQLSTGGAVLPVDVTFSFDRENKSEAELQEIRRRCGGRAHFLPRRMTENYLLSAPAIASVLARRGEVNGTAEAVSEILTSCGSEFLPDGQAAAFDSAQFANQVDGARLLSHVFSVATDARHEYRKVRDAAEIMGTLMDLDENSLDELTSYVRSLLSPEGS